jgi:putative hydrolase of the HAD superfamily
MLTEAGRPDRIEHWIFDLDDTLYPASSGLFAEISARITLKVSEILNLPPEQARLVQRDYWKRYGTSLRGLMLSHDIEPDPFLSYVHDVDVERHVRRDEALRQQLLGLRGRRHIFTNSPGDYAQRVLRALGVDDLFEHVFDVRHSEFVPKPHEHAYQRVHERLQGEPSRYLFVDDAPHNLHTARALGWWTVWLRAPQSVAGGVVGGSVALAEEREPAHMVIDHLAQLDDVVGGYLGAHHGSLNLGAERGATR